MPLPKLFAVCCLHILFSVLVGQRAHAQGAGGRVLVCGWFAVQQECIPQAILGGDIICQAKSGMGKTAVFVISILQQLVPVDGKVGCLVMCHTRELAYQIAREFERFSKFFEPKVKTSVFFGGVNIKKDEATLKNDTPVRSSRARYDRLAPVLSL